MKLPIAALPAFPCVAAAFFTAAVSRADEGLSFARDIQPMLEQSCLPCHNATRAEGGLVLESPRSMIEGGDSGSALKPGSPEESLLFRTAARLEKPFMPPDANKAKAPRLDEAQTEALRRWIREGARGDARPKEPVGWKPMPPNVRVVSSLATSADGRLVAAARANTVAVYDLLLGVKTAEFTAHPDLVCAVVFSPDSTRLATSSHGEVKLWRMERETPPAFNPNLQAQRATSPDGSRTAEITPEGILLRETSSGKELSKLAGDRLLEEKLRKAEIACSGAKFEVTFLENEIKGLSERIAKLTTDLAAVEKERSSLTPKRASIKEKLEETTARRDALERDRDQAEDALMEASAALKKVETAKAEAADVLAATTAGLKSATPETRDSLQSAQRNAQTAADAASARFTSAETAHKNAKDKRDTKQKEYADALKAHGEAAGAASSAVTLDRNARNLAEVLAQSRAEKETQSAALEEAKATLSRLEADRDADAKTGRETIPPPALSVEFDAGGRRLISRHRDGSTRAWNALTGAPLPDASAAVRWVLDLQIGDASRVDSDLKKRVNALAFSPDGRLLATAAGDPSRSGELKIWNVATGKLEREIPMAHKDAVLTLDFSRDGKLLASGSADRAVRLWETGSGKLFRNLEAHASHVLSVSLRADGRRLLSAGADNTVKSWDIQKSDVISTFATFSKEVGFAQYMGRGDEFFAASAAPVLRVLRDSGGEIRSKTAGLPAFITAAALAADGKLQFVGDASGTVRGFDAEGKVALEWRD